MNRIAPFQFNERKAVQAMAVLLKRSGPNRHHNYLRALKLLYLADRRSIEKFGRPITGDRVSAMDHGPVLSLVYDQIKGAAPAPSEWDRFISTNGYDLQLLDDPGNGELCPAEIEILHEIWDEHEGLDQWQLVEETHKLPEWINNKPAPKSSVPIPILDILKALGKEQMFDQIVDHAQESRAIPDFLRG